MMTKALNKNIRRCITQSLGRFIAILLIILLGSAFFTGLKLARPVMLATQRAYLERTQFYDLRLLSTIGFDDTALEELAGIEGVEAIQGGVTADFIWQREEDGEDVEDVIHAMTLTEDVNVPELTAGRMPERADECLLDSLKFSEDMIGQTVEISDLNSDDTKDSFTYTEYTVVGLARTPLYLDLSRGTTALGSGSVTGFMLLPQAGFTSEYYTEVYLTHTGTWEPYSDAYNDMIDDFSDTVSDEGGQIVNAYLDRLVSEAEDTLAEGEQELEDGRSEGQAELDDAWAELEDARIQLEEAWDELEDARLQLEDAETELAEAQPELADAKAELDSSYQTLKDGDDQLAQAKAELDGAKAQLDAGAGQIQENWTSWDGAVSYAQTSLTEGQAALDEAIAQAQAELDASQSQLEALEEAYNSGMAQLEEGRTALEGYEAQLEAGQEAYDEGLAEYESGYAAFQTALRLGLITEEEAQALEEEFAQAKATLDLSKAALDKLTAQLASGQAELEDSEAQLAALATALEEGQKALEEGTDQLETERAAQQAVLDEAAASLQEFIDGVAEYRSGLSAYNRSAQTVSAGWSAYYQGLAEYQDGVAEYEDGLAQYEQGRQEYQDGLTEYQDGLAEYEEGLAEYEDGLAEFQQEIADGEAELQEGRDAVQELRDTTADLYTLGRNTNTGYVTFESDSQIVERLAVLFPVFFFLIAALICSTTMNRMVDDDRTQIGVLRALGYSRGAIFAKYLIYSGTAATAGCVIGYFAGGFLFPFVIWIAYGMLYNISGFVMVYKVIWLILCLAASWICSIGVTYLTCRFTMMTVPADLIRPKTPSAGKRIFLERFTPLWKRLKFLYKVTLRNIFRFKKRMIMMILGIAGCTALVLTGFGLRDSISNLGNLQFDNIMRYDISVTAASPISAEQETQLKDLCGEDLDQSAAVMMYSGDMTGSSGTRTVYIVASNDPDFSQIIDLHMNGVELPLPDTGQVLLSQKAANLTNIKIGDTISLTTSDGQQSQAVVAGLVENFVYNYVYMTGDTYEALFHETYEPETLFVRLQEGADEYAAAAALANADGVASVSVVSDTRDTIDHMMNSLNAVVLLVLASAAALAFIVMFNLGNINISERQREIATIKVLGFHAKETGAYVFRENFILSVLGIILGLPFGVLLHRFVMAQIQIVDIVSFKVLIVPLSYVFTVALVILFTLVTDWILRRKINRIDMAESLKSVE